MNPLAKLLSSRRRQLNKSIRQLIMGTGVSVSPLTISRWERGILIPPMNRLYDLTHLYELEQDIVIDAYIGAITDEAWGAMEAPDAS